METKSIADEVHNATLSAFQGAPANTASICREYKALVGTNLVEDLNNRYNIATVDDLLSRHPDLFRRTGQGWCALGTANVENVLNVMGASKNSRRGGGRGRGGGGAIGRIRHPQQQNAFRSQHVQPPPGLHRRHPPTAFHQQQPPPPLIPTSAQQQHHSPPPPLRFGQQMSRNMNSNNYRYQDDRRFNNEQHSYRASNGRYPSRSPSPPRYDYQYNREDERRQSNRRDDYDRYDRRDEPRFRRMTPSPERRLDDDYDRYRRRSRDNSPSRFDRVRPRSRSHHYDRANVTNRFGVENDEPIYDGNAELRRSATMNMGPPEVRRPEKKTKKVVAETIIKILRNSGGLLRVEELIGLVEKELNCRLPKETYKGEIGILKKLKEDKPVILERMIIDERRNHVKLQTSRPSSRTSEKYEDPSTTRKDLDKLADVDNIINQLELIVKDRKSMREVIELIDLGREGDDEKLTAIALAILSDKHKTFNLSLITMDGIITRTKPIVYSAHSSSPIRSEQISHPEQFPDKRHKLLAREFREQSFEVKITKFLSFDKLFCVRLVEDIEEYERMQRKIQEMCMEMGSPKNVSLSDWKCDDGCLVQCVDGAGAEGDDDDDSLVITWNRGIVSRIDYEDNLLVVRLIDSGLIKSFTSDRIHPMPPSISSIRPFALECRLQDFQIREQEKFEVSQEVWVERFKTSDSTFKITLLKLVKERMVVALKVVKQTGSENDVLADLEEEDLIIIYKL